MAATRQHTIGKEPHMARNHPSVRAIAAAVRANVPVLIAGMPGEAKSASISSWAHTWGRHPEVITGSSRDKGDFMGMPVEFDGEVIYSPPAWVRRLSTAAKSLLIIDELTTAGEAYKLMLRILQERVVGEAQLPDTCSIIAIANPVDIAVDGDDLPAPVANRLMHVNWHFDFDQWAHGLLTDFTQVSNPEIGDMLIREADVQDRWATVVGSIIAFLNNRNDLRSKAPSDPVSAAAGWPSPRSWTNAAKVISHLRPNDDEAIILTLKGCVGEAAAREYLAWLATADLIDPRTALNDPDRVEWAKERPDRLFALITSVTALVMADLTKPNWQKGMRLLVSCAQNGKPDVAIPGARTLLKVRNDDWNMPAGTREAFASILRKMPDVMKV